MHYPVLPEIAVDKVVDTDPKTCLYHGVGCVDIHSGKLGVGGNVTTGENTGIVYVLARISLDIGFCFKGIHGNCAFLR